MVNKQLFFSFILLVFIFGCVAAKKESTLLNETTKLAPADISGTSLVGKIKNLFTGEKLSPPDRIKIEQIHVYEDRVVIEIKNPRWTEFEATKSMDPLFDVGANAINIIPESEEEIQVGDIVVYESDFSDRAIIHRVVKIGEDEKGKYFILKGDNNPLIDPGKVRFSQIKRVLVGIIY